VDASIRAVLDLVGGRGSDIALLFRYCRGAGPQAPSVDALDAAAARIIETRKDSYERLWRGLRPTQRRILVAIGCGASPRSDDRLVEAAEISKGWVSSILRSLETRQVLFREKTGLRFVDSYFAGYLRRTFSAQ
jgi:hypothetical protein